jgi:ParB family chromosome partitioning protein
MTTKKNALGKGLGALIPEFEDKIEDINENKEKKHGVIEIDINSITPNENQPRKRFDEDKLTALAQSIKENGLIQPIIVQKDGEFYKIIAGERRWRAARIAGIKQVPIIEKNITDKEVMEVSLIENLQREDLNPIEEAEAYKRLIDEFTLTQEQISNKVGKSRSAIANSLRLNNLSERVKEYLIDGTISEGHGRVLLAVDDKQLQYEIAQKIIDEALNVRQTEKLIKTLENNKGKRTKKAKDIYLKDMEERFKNLLGTKVIINKGRKKGKIEIEYYSEEDLQRIYDMFNM